MFFDLIGFEDRGSLFLWEKINQKTDYLSIIFYENIVNIKKISDSVFEFGFLIIFEYESDMYKKQFTVLIHQDLNFFLLETENNALFRTQIIALLNKNFENELYFFPKVLTIEEEWMLLKLFEKYNELIISSDEGLIKVEDISGKEKFPILSSIIDVAIKDKIFSVQFFNNGFNFPPRMKEFEIFSFLNQSKDVLAK